MKKFARVTMLVAGIISIIFGIGLAVFSIFFYNLSGSVLNSANENIAATIGQNFDTLFYNNNGLGYEYLLPKVDETKSNKIELPAGVTPDLLSRFIITQAAVQESFSGLRLAAGQLSATYTVLGAIGVFMILFGFFLVALQMQLNSILKKEPLN